MSEMMHPNFNPYVTTFFSSGQSHRELLIRRISPNLSIPNLKGIPQGPLIRTFNFTIMYQICNTNYIKLNSTSENIRAPIP